MTFEECMIIEFNSTSLTGKVFPLNAPEGTPTPYVVYHSAEGIKEKYLSGYSAAGAREIHLEISIFGATYGEMKTASKTVESTIEGLMGRRIGDPINGAFVMDLNYDKTDEHYDSWAPIIFYQTSINATLTVI